MEPWLSQRKSTVGELPDATNESLCEDIMPPSGEDALEILGRTKVGFAPYRPYPFSRRLAPWPVRLGCWTAEIAATLDTCTEYPSSN
jgi:hypothetical protein